MSINIYNMPNELGPFEGYLVIPKSKLRNLSFNDHSNDLCFIFMFITSVKEIMFYPAFVCLSVRPSDSNFMSKLLIGHDRMFVKISPHVSLDMEHIIKFWKPSVSGSSRSEN